mgnify:CR=1 FL=1|tara:strand:+ start:113 stop:346 length:234 start_codon:yes stop_codon:yes gene_type:complete
MATGKYDSPLPKPDVSSHNSNMDYHLNTIKDTLDYLHARRLKESNHETVSFIIQSEKLDSMIHDLIKVVRLIKGLKK